MGSQAIPNGSLAGAVVGVPQIVSWQTLNLFTAVGVQNPATTEAVVELLNVSGSLCRIRFPLSNIQRLLPPNGWIQVSVNRSEVSYEFTPLAVAQIAGLNSIVGIYYPAGTPPSEIVALGGSSSPGNASSLNQTVSGNTSWNEGALGFRSVSLGNPPATTPFVTAIILAGNASTGASSATYPIIGKACQLAIGTSGIPNPPTFFTQEQVGIFPIVFNPPFAGNFNTIPEATLSTISLNPMTLGGSLTILGYYQ